MDTKKLLAISKKARQERKQEKEKRRQEKLQAVENEEEIVEEMLKNQPIKLSPIFFYHRQRNQLPI